MHWCTRLWNVIRITVLTAIVAGTFANTIDHAAAEQIDGGFYENETYGFSFEWDEDIWTVTAVDSENADGMDAESNGSWGSIYATVPEQDPSNCYEDIMASIEANDDVMVKLASKRFTRPEPSGGVQGEMVVMTFDDGSESAEVLFYLGCRPLSDGDAVLYVLMYTLVDSYPYELVRWQDLLGTIEVEDEPTERTQLPEIGIGRTRGETEREDDGPAETGIEGSTYTNAEFGYSVSWDEEFWTVRELSEEEGMGEGLHLEGDWSWGLVQSFKEPEGNVNDCLDAWVSEFEKGTASLENMRLAPSFYERPEPNGLAAGELYLMNIKNENAQLAIYLQCQEVPSTGALIVFTFYTGSQNYESQMPAWQDVLDAVESRPVVERDGIVGAVTEIGA